ncbi:MAG TPA: phosphoadenylyl-sulfate reductase [Phycisphaerae bacterium]|nr:phosphoadenylyl-sulfate reductase [Phycisphaerae bacterium]
MGLPVLIPPPTTKLGETSTPQELVAWSLERFGDRNLVITTSFGMEGCALIDMYARHRRPLDIIYLDTMFFFPETYALRDRLAERYPHLSFINRGTTLTPEEQAEHFGPELWKNNPDQCCKIRKVDPMNEVLTGADVWVTGLRRSQSETRAALRVMEWDWKFQLIKFNPLVSWDRQQVWEYVQSHEVPYNELHERGYPTLGCTHCTKPVEGSQIGDYTRAGRWTGTTKTECGLHGDGI